MTDERTSRPVSGEIMFDAARSASGQGPYRDGDIVDADFITLPSTSVPQRPEVPKAAAAADSARGMDILKSASTGKDKRGGPAFWMFGLALVAGAFWVSGGHALVYRPEVTPQAVVEPEPVAALRIVGVTSRIETSGSRRFVLVDGEVINTGKRPAVLPRLDIRVTDGTGKSTRYVLGTGERRLSPAGRFPFSGRLEAPADGVGTVTVDFSEGVN